PRDVPAAGRAPCRTVIHQIKQNTHSPCDASPIFKIEARPSENGILFFAQVTSGDPCNPGGPKVQRARFCERPLPRGAWIDVQVALRPELDEDGSAALWLDGTPCGTYRGPFGYAKDGYRRPDGTPAVDVQPRFGLYRDWRAETQTIYFDKIM